METHLTDKMSVHMSLLAKQNDQITQANYILIQSNEKLVTKLSAMNKDVEKLKRALLDVTVWLLHKSLGTYEFIKNQLFSSYMEWPISIKNTATTVIQLYCNFESYE